VRITGLNGVDLARFEFDYDTTWHAFFLDRDLRIYSRYGGRDESAADGRQSKESLLTTMGEVLEVHERRQARAAAGSRSPASTGEQGGGGKPGDVRRPACGLPCEGGTTESNRPEQESAATPDRTGDSTSVETASQTGPDFHPPPGKRSTPEDIPFLARAHQGCVHCHQVAEYRLLQSFHDKTFSREQLFPYPLPENVGLRFDRAHGHRVEAVLEDSPAANAGLAAGDVVTRVSDVPIHSEQDVRWALHRAPEGNRPTVTVLRKENDSAPAQTVRVRLDLGPKWRETDLSWRKSLRSVPLSLGFLAYALGREERRSEKFPEDRLFIKVVSIRGGGFAQNLRLEKGDYIVALEGNRTPRSFEEFQSDLLRRYVPGDTVRLTVLRTGMEVDLEGRFPDWHTTDTSVP
jgi:hypothetical protein